MRQHDERGFTLVELVIAMGMFSLVMVAIMVFMTSGSKSYSYSSGELNMQMESQMLINQIRDMVYDSNYAECADDDNGNKALFLYKFETPPRATDAAGEIVVEYEPDHILKKRVIYCKNGQLYYEQVASGTDNDKQPSYPEAPENLLCKYVDKFDATVLDKTGDIQFVLNLKNHTHNSYNLDEKITMRSSWVEFKHVAGATWH